MKYTLQHRCERTMDDKMTLYRDCWFQNLKKIVVNKVTFVGFRRRSSKSSPGSAPASNALVFYMSLWQTSKIITNRQTINKTHRWHTGFSFQSKCADLPDWLQLTVTDKKDSELLLALGKIAFENGGNGKYFLCLSHGITLRPGETFFIVIVLSRSGAPVFEKHETWCEWWLFC